MGLLNADNPLGLFSSDTEIFKVGYANFWLSA